MQSEGTKIGTVIHYFAEPEVGAIRLEDDLAVGDTVAFRGATTDFRQEVTSMEVEHESVDRASDGDEIAVQVEERVREGDEVYRV